MIYCIIYSGFYLGFFVWGEVDPEKKILSRAAARKNFFRLSRGVQGHALPENFENIVFRIG